MFVCVYVVGAGVLGRGAESDEMGFSLSSAIPEFRMGTTKSSISGYTSFFYRIEDRRGEKRREEKIEGAMQTPMRDMV